MAYEPLNLQNGQTLTAEDLQHMEEGIAGVLPQNPGAYQYPATDGDGNLVWEDRLAYSEAAKRVVLESYEMTSWDYSELNNLYFSVSQPPVTILTPDTKYLVT